MQNIAHKLKKFSLPLALLVAGLPGVSGATSVSLEAPGLLPVNDGDLLTFNVLVDFTDVGNALGGGFDLTWDSSALRFEGLRSAGLGDPAFARDPDVFDGLLESWAIAEFFAGIGAGLVGSVQFSVLPSMGLSTIVALAPTSGIGGPWIELAGVSEIQDVQYGSVEVTRSGTPGVIPVPAAIWLFATAVLGFAGYTWRKKA